MNSSNFKNSIVATLENGDRLLEDAKSMLEWERFPTSYALAILAQEEFAKVFLLHLVGEGIIPWTAKVHESLRNHWHKQLIGLIMEWLKPSDDEFFTRIKKRPGDYTLPAHVADAMKLYVEKVQPKGHISCPPDASDPRAKSVADGDRDKMKQDAIYVRLSKDGDVISVPTQVTPEMTEIELDITKRLSDLVRPLREGSLGPVLDYDILLETMRFLLLDKRNRPFLILKETKFGGPVTLQTGVKWPHSITVLIENISDEQATIVNGHATVFLDKEAVTPSFIFNQFAVDSYTTKLCTLFVSLETHACGTSPLHTLDLYINLEYHGVNSNRKYHVSMWSTYDSSVGSFRETLTDLQKSVDGGSPSQEELETKWRHPTST